MPSTARCAWLRRWSTCFHVLSEVAPDWVLAHVPVEWVERYGERVEHERLPKEEEERKQYANQVGADGWMLLAVVGTLQISHA